MPVERQWNNVNSRCCVGLKMAKGLAPAVKFVLFDKNCLLIYVISNHSLGNFLRDQVLYGHSWKLGLPFLAQEKDHSKTPQHLHNSHTYQDCSRLVPCLPTSVGRHAGLDPWHVNDIIFSIIISHLIAVSILRQGFWW